MAAKTVYRMVGLDFDEYVVRKPQCEAPEHQHHHGRDHRHGRYLTFDSEPQDDGGDGRTTHEGGHQRAVDPQQRVGDEKIPAAARDRAPISGMGTYTNFTPIAGGFRAAHIKNCCFKSVILQTCRYFTGPSARGQVNFLHPNICKSSRPSPTPMKWIGKAAETVRERHENAAPCAVPSNFVMMEPVKGVAARKASTCAMAF